MNNHGKGLTALSRPLTGHIKTSNDLSLEAVAWVRGKEFCCVCLHFNCGGSISIIGD